MIYAVIIFIVILFVMATIAYITYLVWHYPTVAPPLQPEQNVAPPLQPEQNIEIGIDNATLRTWPTLTYAEASSQDPRAAASCSVCLVDYEEKQDEDNALRLLPECGHLFHAKCVDPWLRWRQTCPLCRSLVVIDAMQTPSTEVIPTEIE